MKEIRTINVKTIRRQALGVACEILMLLVPCGVSMAQESPDTPPPADAAPPSAASWSPNQLANLVAPIALYPDALLSQVLVASTYPLEIVEAAQWLRQNRNLQGQQLVDAARQQNWDPSIQALVVFPDVIGRLNSDIRWTTDLGNAFLAQQADVMNAVQRLRSQAMAAGKLNSNAQERVTTQSQDGQTAIDIQPANPQVVYVPTYNPEYIWGPPVYGYYPPLFYPGFGFGFGFGPGIYIGSFFGGLGWGGWGWGPNWFGGGIVLNGFFFNHYGFHGYYGGFRGGAWAFNPAHRLGVPYANRAVANRFGGNFAGRSAAAPARSFAGASNGFARGAGSSQFSRPAGSSSQNGYRGGSAYGGNSAYRAAPSYNSGARSYSGNNGAARSTPSYHSSAPSSRSSAPAAHSSSGGGSHGGGHR